MVSIDLYDYNSLTTKFLRLCISRWSLVSTSQLGMVVGCTCGCSLVFCCIARSNVGLSFTTQTNIWWLGVITGCVSSEILVDAEPTNLSSVVACFIVWLFFPRLPKRMLSISVIAFVLGAHCKTEAWQVSRFKFINIVYIVLYKIHESCYLPVIHCSSSMPYYTCIGQHNNPVPNISHRRLSSRNEHCWKFHENKCSDGQEIQL